MTHISARWASWLRWMRRPDVIGALMAVVFVCVLLGAGIHAIVTMHGFHLAGG